MLEVYENDIQNNAGSYGWLSHGLKAASYVCISQDSRQKVNDFPRPHQAESV